MANQPAAWRQAVTYRLDRDLVARAKAAAAANHEPEIALVTRALERELLRLGWDGDSVNEDPVR